MPLFVADGRTPVRWAGQRYTRAARSAVSPRPEAHLLRVALVNNMPDSALEDTEEQFFSMLDAAAPVVPVQIELYSLPNVPRSERARQHLDHFYSSTTELVKQRFDGVIITGTEPKQPDLRDEPYWDSLTEVFDWAESNSASTVLSCLAAHAGALHSDGIARNPMGQKRFGVFDHDKAREHFLTSGMSAPIRIPHSRWNELREDALLAAGYTVLTRSEEAGADLFVKEKKNSLFVHFQGHPEYMALTLFKEYRRDVRRYLRRERETYPRVPEGYFDADATRWMDGFQAMATAARDEKVMESFPEAAVMESLKHSWGTSAAQIYRNWLQFLADKKVEAAEHAVMARVGHS